MLPLSTGLSQALRCPRNGGRGPQGRRGERVGAIGSSTRSRGAASVTNHARAGVSGPSGRQGSRSATVDPGGARGARRYRRWRGGAGRASVLRAASFAGAVLGDPGELHAALGASGNVASASTTSGCAQGRAGLPARLPAAASSASSMSTALAPVLRQGRFTSSRATMNASADAGALSTCSTENRRPIPRRPPNQTATRQAQNREGHQRLRLVATPRAARPRPRVPRRHRRGAEPVRVETPAPPLPMPDPAKATIEGWKPRQLPGGEWGAILKGPNVADLPTTTSCSEPRSS